MLWGILALIAGMTYCIQTEANKSYQISGFTLNTFRSFIAVVILSPLLPFMEWPVHPEYYFVVIFESAVSVVCMMAQYNLAAKKCGRVACMHQPISLMLTFIFWLSLDESQRVYLLSSPEKAIGIGLAFFLFIISLQFIRKNDAGWSALLSVLPIAILYAMMSVVSKIALESGDTLFEISLNFVFLCNLGMFLLSWPFYYAQRRELWRPSVHILKGAGIVSISHTVSWVFACAAVILTPNPAYVSVICGLAPLWFMLYYKVKGIRDDASPVAGVFLMLSAILILLSS